ncbi:MAG TPA: hypothetical protein VMU78_00950, partial [Methylocella sp.]|nr:hypothetical protein [Methylocella sp.]
GQHKMDDAIPVTKWLVRVLEDCPGYMGKAIAGFGRALIALPAPRPVKQLVGILCTATRATNAFWPSTGHQISAARIFVGEHLFKFRNTHLMDWFRLLTGHNALPFDNERILA